VVNTIVGNALSEAPDGTTAISLTPPVVMSQAKSLICHKNAYFYLSDLRTPLGVVSIMYIGPKALFDETLESREHP
jgi:CheY-specific phosphatase CheX